MVSDKTVAVKMTNKFFPNLELMRAMFGLTFVCYDSAGTTLPGVIVFPSPGLDFYQASIGVVSTNR